MANNPFIGNANPPDTIFGGISQSGALGGQLSSRRTEPLISMYGEELARVTFGSGLIYDPFNVWVDSGNPPAPSGGMLTGSGVRESVGPFATGQTIRLPGGGANGVTHFAGDFSMAFVVKWAATAGGVLYQDGTFNVAGYLLSISTGSAAVWRQSGSGVAAQLTVNAPSTATGLVSVVCAGRSGSTIVGKMNLGTLASTATIAYVPATGDTVLGATAAGGGTNPFLGEIYEAWISTQTPSDALFTTIMNEVKTKLGITAW